MPRPLQCLHLSLTMLPRPPQVGHTCENENGPWSTATAPDPPHVVHTSGSVPGFAPLPPHTEHGASDVMLTDVVAPCTASRKSRCSSVSRSCPRWGPAGTRPRWRPPRPPNRFPRMSPKPPMSPTSSKRTFWNAATEPAGPARAAEPARADAGRDHLADLVVLLALLGVAEHVVRGRDLLEALLGVLVPGVRVGVVLLGELPVRARDVLLGRPLRHAEHLVVVLLEPLPLRSHHRYPLRVTRTIAGRIMRPLSRYPVRMVSATARLATRRRPGAPPRARSDRTTRRRPRCARDRPSPTRVTSWARMLSTPLRTFSISGVSPETLATAPSNESSTGSRSSTSRSDARSTSAVCSRRTRFR